MLSWTNDQTIAAYIRRQAEIEDEYDQVWWEEALKRLESRQDYCYYYECFFEDLEDLADDFGDEIKKFCETAVAEYKEIEESIDPSNYENVDEIQADLDKLAAFISNTFYELAEKVGTDKLEEYGLELDVIDTTVKEIENLLEFEL